MKEEDAFHEATMLLSSTASIKGIPWNICTAVLDRVAEDYERLRELGFDRHSSLLNHGTDGSKRFAVKSLPSVQRRPTTRIKLMQW